jgi:hypothetical protein
MSRVACCFAVLTLLPLVAHGQYVQQGQKLVGSGSAAGAASALCGVLTYETGVFQGTAVALSTDGNTAAVGGPGDTTGIGGTWIFTRSGSSWSAQGGKLVGSGFINRQGLFGYSGYNGVCQGGAVALSADGNTLISGGAQDNGGNGAAWVFTRSSGSWSQQGPRLGVTDAAISQILLGSSVALSADGNTALLGGPSDYNEDGSIHTGATWAFTRSFGFWNQQGSKLVAPTQNVYNPLFQGFSVALSADGNTAIEGSPYDMRGFVGAFTRNNGNWSVQPGGSFTVNSAETFGQSVSLSSDGNTALVGSRQTDGFKGAAYVFVRSNGQWIQQAKLTGSDATTGAQQGFSVSISGDGNTAVVGGPNDGTNGAAWVYKRSGTTWAQLGSKLIGSGASGFSSQGSAVAISSDGSTVLVGGPADANNTGAVWVYVQGSSGGGTAPVGVNPPSGAASSQSIQFTFTDSPGYQDLDVVNVLINNFLDGRSACYLAYSRPANVLYLVADDGGTLLGLPMNGSGSVGNSQCTVTGAGSSASGNGAVLTLTLNLSFTPAFAGYKVTYMAARDLEGGNSGWHALGTWAVPGLIPFPLPASASPPHGSGSSETLTAIFLDTKGAQDLGVVNILINNFLDGRSACYLAYSQPFKVLYLVGDAGGGLSPGLTLGGTGSVSNSQCTVNASGSSASVSGNALTLTLNISFTPAFDGDRVVYLAARDSAEANNSGWQAMATITVQ